MLVLCRHFVLSQHAENHFYDGSKKPGKWALLTKAILFLRIERRYAPFQVLAIYIQGSG